MPSTRSTNFSSVIEKPNVEEIDDKG